MLMDYERVSELTYFHWYVRQVSSVMDSQRRKSIPINQRYVQACVWIAFAIVVEYAVLIWDVASHALSAILSSS